MLPEERYRLTFAGRSFAARASLRITRAHFVIGHFFCLLSHVTLCSPIACIFSFSFPTAFSILSHRTLRRFLFYFLLSAFLLCHDFTTFVPLSYKNNKFFVLLSATNYYLYFVFHHSIKKNILISLEWMFCNSKIGLFKQWNCSIAFFQFVELIFFNCISSNFKYKLLHVNCFLITIVRIGSKCNQMYLQLQKALC